MAGCIHASLGHRLTQITWYRCSDAGGARKQSRVFPAGTMVTIGRGPDQAIILDDDGVSRNHARVEINHGKVLFEDLGSTNGSLLNGTQRIKRMDWRPGQRIRVGNYMLEVAFGVDEASDATIIGPVRRPLGHLAGMPPAGPKQQRVLPRVVPAAQARLDPPPADPSQPLNRTVVDEGQDAARPIDAGVAPGEVAIPQKPSQHPLEIAADVGEMASSSKPSAGEAEATSTGISATQADTHPPLEMTGNASSIIQDAKGVGSPPTHDTEATPARVSTPQAQDTPWPEIAGSADQSVDETQNGTHSVQESALLGATSAQAIVHPLPEIAHSVGPIIDTTGEGPPLRADAVSMPPRASVPQLYGTLVEHQAQTNNKFAYDDLRRRERERRRRTLAALTAALFLVIAGSCVSYWEMMHPKIAYYRQLVWRWGVPEGLGLIDDEIRGHRFLTYRVTTQRPGITQSPRVVEVRLENSAGQLSGDGPIRMDGTHARWVVRYREDGSPDKIEIFDRTGHLMREEVLRKDPSKDTIIVDFERRSLPLMQTATQTLMFDPLDTRQQGFDTKSEISRHELSFDKNGFVVERHYLTHWGERQSDAQGSFGQRFTYTHEGLVLTRVEIGADNKQITLRNGQSAAVFTYDGNLNPFRCKLTGADGQPINGPNGFAYYSREFDRWGNDTVIAYYGIDGKPVLHKDGYAKITKRYDDRGNLIEGAHFGLDGNPTLDKDGVAKGTIRYDDRGNVVEVALFDVNDKPTPDKQGVTKYTIRYDPFDRIIETAAFGIDGKPTLGKNGVAKYVRQYDERGNVIEEAFFGVDSKPTLHKDGYAKIAKRYDDRGKVRSAFGIDGRPTLDKNGIAKIKPRHDERGNQIEATYFGLEGEPALHKDGYAGYRQKFDERGNVVEWAAFGVDGKRVLHKDGYAILRRKFDERGKMIEVAYFDVDEKPVAFKAGYARITHSYDEKGRSLGSKYFDKDDHEVTFDVVVTKIVPGTTAERIGLAPQDRIMNYNDVKPTSVQQFVDLAISTSGATSRRIVIRRDQNILTFEVQAGRLGVYLDTAAQDSGSTRRE
jgi:FHA domain/PDZ domain